MGDQFDEMMQAEFPSGVIDLGAEADQAKPKLTQEQQSNFWLAEATHEIVSAFHLHGEAAQWMSDWPEWPEIATEGVLGYVKAHDNDPGDPMKLIDILDRLGALGIALGTALSVWAGEHQLPPHIHLWVYLTGVGPMPCMLGHGEGQADFWLPVPRVQ